MKFKVVEDSLCEQYVNELTRHYRPGLKMKKLFKNDEVEFIEEWENMYGKYIRVRKNGIVYDMLPKNLKRL